MYMGGKKLIYYRRRYPKDKYEYNYAISDSKSDLELLKLFSAHELLL